MADCKVIDLFAGCGGLSLGLYQAGWNGVFAVEKDSCAFSTLKYNLIDCKKHFDWPDWLSVGPVDIVELIDKYAGHLEKLRGEIDLVAGGPPCQGFSMAGKRVEDDIRNKLVFSYIDFIAMVRPRILLFENVKGFTSAFDKKNNPEAVPYSSIVAGELQKLGYEVSAQVIDIARYGVPQRRRRFILVGIYQGAKGSAEQFFARLECAKSAFLQTYKLKETCTLKEAISDLLKQNGCQETPDRKGFESGVYGKKQSAYQHYLRKGVSVKQLVPNSHSFAHHTEEKHLCLENLLKNYPVRGKRIDGKEREKWGIRQRGITVLDAQSQSPTLTNMPDDYLHYCEPRILTVRECARIQSFPDWYEFKSKYTTGGQLRKKEVPRYSQVGNAIPPLFARQAGLVLKQMLEEMKNG